MLSSITCIIIKSLSIVFLWQSCSVRLTISLARCMICEKRAFEDELLKQNRKMEEEVKCTLTVLLIFVLFYLL